MSQAESPLLPSGVPYLDRLLGGGLPARRTLLLTGLPGTGKSILVGQLAFAQAARGVPSLIATATGEPHTRLLESLQGFSFFERERLGREVFLLSAEAWLRKGARELREMLLASVRERGARLLVLDGLRSLGEAWGEPARVREFLGDLAGGLAASDCTGVLVDDREPGGVLLRPEAAVADGVVGLAVEPEGVERVRRIEVLKLRGRFPLEGPHGLRLGTGGVQVVPRLEVLEQEVGPGLAGRVPSGVAGLDALLGGGLPAGAVALLSGPPRTGKSLLAAAFAAAEREPVVHLLLHEPVHSLVARAAAVGVELGPAHGTGRWSALAVPEAALHADEAAQEVLARAERLGARRVVVDGLEVLGRAVRPRSRLRAFAGALVNALRARGLTALLTLDPTDGEEAAALARWLRVDVRLALGAPARSGPWPLVLEQAPPDAPVGAERLLRVAEGRVEVVGASEGRGRNQVREGLEPPRGEQR